MRATGIVRKIDCLGRIVLPVELRKTLGLNLRDTMEIFVDDGCIVLRKYEPHCIFCGEVKQLTQYRGKNVCMDCAKRLGGMKSI